MLVFHQIIPFMKKIITLFVCVNLLAYTAFGQVLINEFSTSNLNGFLDNYERTEDWIELYNATNQAIDLGGYHLSDKESKPAKWKIPAGTIIPANGYLVFWCSGRDEVSDGNYHTNFKMAQTKNNEIVLLSDPNEIIIEMFDLDLTLVEHSRCRAQDGSDNWVVCTNPSPNASNNGTDQFASYTVSPSMDMEAGFYDETIIVTIINNEDASVLRYTVDGSNPVEISPVYTEPLTVNETTVIKARAFSENENVLPGKMDFNTYFINEEFTLAVFSVAADEVVNLANGDGELIPIGSLEYFNLDKERAATSFGSLNRHGQDSWILPHRSIDWVSRDEMGYSKAVKAELFGYSNRDEYQKFMFRNSGDDNYPANDDDDHEGSTHIRDEYVQTLAQIGGMKLDQRAVERVILFLNGEYWGLYGLRERPVDHDYTNEYYDQGKYDLQYLTTWATTEIQYGGEEAVTEWEGLRDFILTNDMGVEENYQTVKDQLQVTSLIDYMIVNLNCVASDWLNYNTGWWRGLDPEGDHKKWGYILWDLDATFDYYINYSGVPNISPDARPCDINEIADFMDDFFDTGSGGGTPVENPDACATIINGSSPYAVTDTVFLQTIAADIYCCETDWDSQCQDLYDSIANGGGTGGAGEGDVGKHEKIFLKLQEESDEFRQLYYSRQADMQNTVYSCENMMYVLDSMLAVIEPEMPRQIERWGGSMQEWEENVQDLKNFIGERCLLFDEGMVGCFDLSGPYNLTLKVEPQGVGEIKINTIDVETFPWTGAYYGEMDNKVKAKATDDNYVFSHWEQTAGSLILPDSTERKARIRLENPDTLTAVFTQVTATNELQSGIALNVFPNPATNQLTIKYELDQPMEVNISLYSITGQKVLTLDNQNNKQAVGVHVQEIDIVKPQLPTGVYILKLQASQHQMARKVTIVK